MAHLSRHVLPGFRLSLGFTLVYLAVFVLIPLTACGFRVTTLSWDEFVRAAWSERTRAAYGLSFGASLTAAAISLMVGLLLAWVLVRYDFPLKRFFDSLIDLPFALPTAVAGLVFSNLYVPTGWLGRWLYPWGVELAYTRSAVVLVLVFIGFPFVVRAVQPVLEAMDVELEEAAAVLGATRWQTFRRVLFPSLAPSLVTGFALALARALGEYGSVVFVSGNIPFRTEIAPVLIVARLEEFRYAEATAIAVVLLIVSFALLIMVNWLERRTRWWDK
jgi:sulfate transport system permease protein